MHLKAKAHLRKRPQVSKVEEAKDTPIEHRQYHHEVWYYTEQLREDIIAPKGGSYLKGINYVL